MRVFEIARIVGHTSRWVIDDLATYGVYAYSAATKIDPVLAKIYILANQPIMNRVAFLYT